MLSMRPLKSWLDARSITSSLPPTLRTIFHNPLAAMRLRLETIADTRHMTQISPPPGPEAATLEVDRLTAKG